MSKLMEYIQLLLSSMRSYRRVPYQIESIDVTKGTMLLRLSGSCTVIKTTIIDTIGNPKILSALTPLQACCIGGYYGRFLRKTLVGKEAIKTMKKMAFLLNGDKGQYKIIYQNRDGSLGYIHKKIRKEFVEQPLILVNSKKIISKFDPSQACYIGILAGISMDKIEKSSEKKEQGSCVLPSAQSIRPKLRLVK